MDPAALRIIDANLNRAGEGLRLLEEHARLVLGDEGLSARAKAARHGLAEIGKRFGVRELLAARDIEGDVGTGISTEAERRRENTAEVAGAGAKRAAESMRCIEEYGKIIDAATAQGVEQLRYEVYALEQGILIGGPRRARLRSALLHVMVTEELCRGPWLTVCEQAIAGGADVLQLREKSLGDDELLDRARRLRELTREHDVLLIINDRVDIARLAGADGVHLGQGDLPVSQGRQIVGPHLLIGTSTHSIAEARAALGQGPDYVAVGPMFRSATKPELAVRGPGLLGEVAELADVPVVAVGGITAENVGGLSVGGRLQVAVCQAVIGAADPAAAARELRDRLSAGPGAAG